MASASRRELSSLFLKRTSRMPDGRVAEPVELAGDGPVRARFCQEVHGKSLDAVRSYWHRLVFAGREVPPVEKAHEEDVLDFVRSRPGAIGVVSAGASEEGVRVVSVKD